MWFDLACLTSIFFKFAIFKVGKWQIIRFLKDTCFGEIPLPEAFPEIYNISLKTDTTMTDCWDNVPRNWKLSIRRRAFGRDLLAFGSLFEMLESF